MAIATTDPATGRVLKTFDAMSTEQVRQRIGAAADAFAVLRVTTFAQRSEWMRAAADILDADTGDVAAMMTAEMGKTLKSARAEVAKCATGCRY
ncbi:MAG: succinate-semialdehyde dehydrogenase / glutarate-semialdehyde dehydrogenase, partial [Cryptosporangiaceae bacterium]|nr:succinate-semialdehyde dehydrogenase / glutarate-semialdehyde dehydrogenase [Cryptosporangiaceae bacterium]